jgi:hypothetical protein
VSTETGSGGDGVIGRLQPGQVTVGSRNVICIGPPTHRGWALCNGIVQSKAAGKQECDIPAGPPSLGLSSNKPPALERAFRTERLCRKVQNGDNAYRQLAPFWLDVASKLDAPKV